MNTKTIKENFFALLIAFFLAGALVLVINNTGFLKADIIGNQGAEKQTGGDVIYTPVQDGMSIQANKDFTNIKSISLVVMYDKDKAKLTKQNIKTDFDFGSSDAGEGAYTIMLQNLSEIKKGTKLIDISGYDGKLFNVSEVIVNFSNGKAESLSITKR